jgi:DNA-binding Xre family transcriptional regulator
MAVRLRVADLMESRGISAYALGKGAGLGYPTAYRLSRPGGEFGRLEQETLNRLCEFFEVQPGELLEWTPDRKRTRSKS